MRSHTGKILRLSGNPYEHGTGSAGCKYGKRHRCNLYRTFMLSSYRGDGKVGQPRPRICTSPGTFADQPHPLPGWLPPMVPRSGLAHVCGTRPIYIWIWICMCMCMYIYMYIYICVCVFIYIHIERKREMQRYTFYLHLHFDVFVYLYIDIHLYIYI